MEHRRQCQDQEFGRRQPAGTAVRRVGHRTTGFLTLALIRLFTIFIFITVTIL